MSIMAIAIIPVAVSVHTIVSFDFSMAPVPMWHSTIFGPYFVAGAIFSGIAGLIIAMAAFRRFLHLAELSPSGAFREPRQAAPDDEPVLGILRLYERLTVWYGNHERNGSVLGDAARLVRAALLADGR